MISEKIILSASDSSDSEDASPFAKQQKLEISKAKPRTGKGALERRRDKNRERMNQRTYEQRLTRCLNPQNLFSRTTDMDSLESKFQQWDEILKNGGTIFDDSEVIGPILIETESLGEAAQDKHKTFIANRSDDILEIDYSNLISDEISESMLTDMFVYI